MECFVIIANGFQPLTIITERSILDVAAALDPSMSRAIHLELTNDLSVEPLKLAVHRFISRRGTPSCLISGNFKTFKSVEIKRFISNIGIQWKFTLERSTWWGGFYERLVGLVKSCMKKVISRARLSFKELNTVIIEVEKVLNGLPLLTYLSGKEYCSSLTPNHLMYGRNLFNSSKGVGSEISASIDCQKIVQHHVVVKKHFKQRFINEYLSALQEKHCYQNKRKSIKNNIKIGEVVLTKEGKIMSFEMAERQNYKFN